MGRKWIRGRQGLSAEDGWEMIAKRYKISLQGDEDVLKWIVVVAARFCEYTKSH